MRFVRNLGPRGRGEDNPRPNADGPFGLSGNVDDALGSGVISSDGQARG